MRTITVNGIQYNIDVNGAMISVCDDLEEIVVPESVESVPVTSADAYAFSRKKIMQLALPRYLKKIGRYAFYRCFTLEKLCFSDELMDIGAGAFTGCNPKEIEIDFYNGEKSCLKFIADEVKDSFRVTMRFHKEDGKVEQAVVVFPAHHEEAVENTPARILETHYYGAGVRYCQCFYDKELNFQEYDSMLIWAITEDTEEMVVDIVSSRLKYPYKLTDHAKKTYEEYLKAHMECAGTKYVLEENAGMLKFFCDERYFTKESLEAAIEVAAREKKTDVLSLLMDEKRKSFPQKKKTFEF